MQCLPLSTVIISSYGHFNEGFKLKKKIIENPKTHFFTRYAFNEWLKPISLVNTITKQYDKTIYSITITVFLLKTVSLFY